MSKFVVTVAGTLAAVALLASHPAQAGASASAPSKYSASHQVTSTHVTRTARGSNFGITEYSSSSAKRGTRDNH